jgi:outer membrane protein OmpA-like peptidoglycan-associated protein
MQDSATTPAVLQSTSIGANHPDLQKAHLQLRSDDDHREERLVLAPGLLNPPDTEPDAVVVLDPKSGALAPAMDAQLAIIADELTKNDRLLVRLESYVPSGGSPALEIGIADKALRKVREHLVSQGVSPRRMLFSSFGGESSKERHSRRHWVELYLVRRGY